MALRSASSRRLKRLEITLPEAFRKLFQPFRYKAFYGGRGSGKSHAMATALVLLSAQKPLRILAARETQQSIRESSKRLLDDRIQALGLTTRFTSTETEIKASNGSRFLFAGLGHNPDQIKSMEGIDIAWIEEADTISQRSLDILVPTIRKPNSELWFSWNPRHASDPVDHLFRSSPARDDALVRPVSFADNPWFPEVLEVERRWDQKRDPDKYRHIWEGAYRRHSEARVFSNWRIDRLEMPAGARPYFGADWGFSNDPTVLVRATLLERLLYIDREAYRIGCPIDETAALFATVDGAAGPAPWPITADSSRPEMIAHLRTKGFRIKPARKGKGSVGEGVAFLRSLDIVVHPDCRHTIDELTLYSYAVDRHTGEILPVLEDRQNHIIDALRYALEGVRRADYQLLKLL
ncbi:PBSX family phage terminase large subunit [Lichenihabitans sp. PAMC28606]|uniref:PBSX family phage terminase large subunit n=1 Tax=Lichenihabitans sp. PAMC28606 TaxID=2880932 RepID=UPI001D0B65AC|nr:PBSX family phage terminase large subunit [Lichenihabitans sp. PAMC28606]UDL93961.1 PBSX family phage terminase large subunit [Lichenihabitans sp. PAMC28606]